MLQKKSIKRTGFFLTSGNWNKLLLIGLSFGCFTGTAVSQSFYLPTANEAIFEEGKEEQFFVGTVGNTWVSGTYGCVRSSGGQFHEGIDIKSISSDKNGEPTDPILATADGEVVYFNENSALSNFGKYIVLRHEIDRLEVYSLYAHLSTIREDLSPGVFVKAREQIGVMGRTSNTSQRISKERAHVHFELNLLVNDRFEEFWKEEMEPSGYSPNDHGKWNGLNLVGLNVQEILVLQKNRGPSFNLLDYIRYQDAMARVLVPKNDFPWLHHYPMLIQTNPVSEREGIAAYEMWLTFNGLPFRLIPRAQSELDDSNSVRLLEVDKPLRNENRCCNLVVEQGSWRLTNTGKRWIERLIY